MQKRREWYRLWVVVIDHRKKLKLKKQTRVRGEVKIIHNCTDDKNMSECRQKAEYIPLHRLHCVRVF